MANMSLQSTYGVLPPPAAIGSYDIGATNVTTLKNANASASMPIGSVFAWKVSGATSDKDVVSVATPADLIAGIVARADEYSRVWTDENGSHGELDSVGIVAGVMFNALRVGRIFVTNQTAVKPGDRLFVSYNTGGTIYTAAGQMGNVAEASHSIDASSKGEWRSTAAALAGAWLEVDFVNK